ncbi:DUF4862 family protein [Microbacterium sp. P5_E9]
MALMLGTYALAWGRSEAEHAEVVRAASEHGWIDGLEVPWTGSLAADLPEVLTATRPDWRIAITSLPGTMAQVAGQPAFGLASSDPDGRRAAMTDAANLRSAVAALNDALGRAAVAAIEVHSAPRTQDVPSGCSALARSLEAIADWDWDGAQLLLEHVDAKVAGLAPAKGFLTLQDELEVITENSLPIGILINWGRSAIELRDAAQVIDHVALARESGVLKGLIFSGASAVATDHGEAWADQHLPASRHEPNSLLTAELMDDALRVAGPLDFTGVKMAWRGSLQDGTEMLLDTARTVSAITDRYRHTTP